MKKNLTEQLNKYIQTTLNEAINNDFDSIDYEEDMDKFYNGKDSKYKYPEVYEVDFDTALELTGYSGRCTDPGHEDVYYLPNGDPGYPGCGPEFELPSDNSEISEAYAEDMAKKFAKLNNISEDEVLQDKALLYAFEEYNEDIISAEKMYDDACERLTNADYYDDYD